MRDTIYIPLLNEGVEVWRPAPGWRVGPTTYIVLRPDDYDPESETWEFPPGSTVDAERRSTSEGDVLAAVRRAKLDRLTA